jgi:hypothetical protein
MLIESKDATLPTEFAGRGRVALHDQPKLSFATQPRSISPIIAIASMILRDEPRDESAIFE